MKLFQVLQIALLYLSLNYCSATTITSIACGRWTDADTWDLNRIPESTDTIIVDTYVGFDTGFTTLSPGILKVTQCGTLCGTHSFNGCFSISGAVYMDNMTCNYGASFTSSSASVNIQQYVHITNMGTSYTNNGGTICVGCTTTCIPCAYSKGVDPNPCLSNGINKQAKISDLKCFPTLITDKIYLEYTNFSGPAFYTIYNLLGKVVLKNISQFENGKSMLLLDNLPANTYFIRLYFSENGGFQQARFIRE